MIDDDDPLELELGLVGTSDVDEGDVGLWNCISELRFGAIKVHRAVEATPPPGAVEEEEETDEDENRKEEVIDKGEEVVATVALKDGDVDTVHVKNIDEVKVVEDDNGGMAVIDGGELEGTAVFANANMLHLTLLHQGERELSRRSKDGWGWGAAGRIYN